MFHTLRFRSFLRRTLFAVFLFFLFFIVSLRNLIFRIIIIYFETSCFSFLVLLFLFVLYLDECLLGLVALGKAAFLAALDDSG